MEDHPASRWAGGHLLLRVAADRQPQQQAWVQQQVLAVPSQRQRASSLLRRPYRPIHGPNRSDGWMRDKYRA